MLNSFLQPSNRFMPPVTPSTWKTTRLADRFAPVCPQTVPVTDTGMEALLEMPRGRLAQLRRMKPLLANYSEDCLYLNMYVPREGKKLKLSDNVEHEKIFVCVFNQKISQVFNFL